MTTQSLEGMPKAAERRQFERKKFNGALEMEWGATILTGTVRDIGRCGLFVEMNSPLWLGAAFRARLLVNPVLCLDCTVVRIEPRKGVALRFEIAEEDGRAQLELLLASLPPV